VLIYKSRAAPNLTIISSLSQADLVQK